jgi:phosphohistidine phosphatase
LTDRGIARFKQGVAGLGKLDAVVDEILTSPLVRAKQTADLLSSGLDSQPPVRLLDALSPGHEPDQIMAQLARTAKRRRIALVGHEPGLGELAAHLIGARRPLAFRKGGVCRIDLVSLTSKRAGALIWFATPRMLRGVRS